MVKYLSTISGLATVTVIKNVIFLSQYTRNCVVEGFKCAG